MSKFIHTPKGLMYRCTCFVVASITFASCMQSQAAFLEKPEFDVVSIRPCDTGDMVHMVKIEFAEDGFSASHVTLELLLEVAYGVDDMQILGAASWVNSKEYNIEARVDAHSAVELRTLNEDRRKQVQREMLQALLADRFKLTIHREEKELPIYSLVVTKRQSGLHEAKTGNVYNDGERWPGGQPMGAHSVSYEFIGGQVHMEGQAASLDLLVDRLTQKRAALQLGRKIVDNTGLIGKYDFNLNFKVPWPPGAAELPMSDGISGSDSATTEQSTELSLFTALQEQLGLKLEPTKGPVETIVLAHVEMPSEN